MIISLKNLLIHTQVLKMSKQKRLFSGQSCISKYCWTSRSVFWSWSGFYRNKPGLLGQDYQVTQQANDQVTAPTASGVLAFSIHRSLVGSKNASLLHFCTNPGIVDKNAPQNCCKINAALAKKRERLLSHSQQYFVLN